MAYDHFLAYKNNIWSTHNIQKNHMIIYWVVTVATFQWQYDVIFFNIGKLYFFFSSPKIMFNKSYFLLKLQNFVLLLDPCGLNLDFYTDQQNASVLQTRFCIFYICICLYLQLWCTQKDWFCLDLQSLVLLCGWVWEKIQPVFIQWCFDASSLALWVSVARVIFYSFFIIFLSLWSVKCVLLNLTF